MFKLLFLAATLSILLLPGSALAYRFNLISLDTSFTLLITGMVLGVLTLLAALILLLMGKFHGTPVKALGLTLGLLLLALALPLASYFKARSVPMIHDITTDTGNPPLFVDIVALREEDPKTMNPPGYAGSETAAQQQEAYPDIVTTHFSQARDVVFHAVETEIASSGWQLVAAEASEGRIEATATTFWFGFKDDVVFRIATDENGTVVDMRSKSRVGKSDLGVNAQRIRDFMDRLRQRLN